MKKYLITLIIILIPFICEAAPSVSSYTGDVADGNSIVLSGANFGTGATIHKWDDFDGGANEEDIGNGWSLPDADNHPVYSNSNNRTNSTLNAYSNNGTDDLEYDHNATLSTVYATFWIYSTRSITDNTYNNKWGKIWYDGVDSHPEITLISQWSGPGTQCNLCDQGLNYVFVDSINNLTVSTWERVEIYAEESTAPGGTFDGTEDGNVYVWQQTGGEGNAFTLTASQENVATNNNGSSRHWERVCLMEYNRSSGGATTTRVDDIYIASSRARVEIGDNADYNNCSHREMQIPENWTSSNVSFTVNQGSFNLGDDAYIFIVDQAGNVSNSFEVVWGGEIQDPGPPGITGTPSVTNIP